MEQAAAAQVAIDAAEAAAAAAEQAASDAEAVLDSGPVSSVNGQTGVVALGMGDIPNLVASLGAKANDNHGHEIAQVSNLQAALDGIRDRSRACYRRRDRATGGAERQGREQSRPFGRRPD